MTRDEHRAKCIEAMRAAYRTELNADGRWEEMRGGLRAMIAAFDSLHEIAFVDPIEVTEEMVSVELNDLDCTPIARDLLIIFDAMAAAGDLTNPPEEKP